MTASVRSEPGSPRRRAILVLVVLGVLAAAGFTVAVSYAFAAFRVVRVEGHAMAPTLRDQDRLVVDKMAYREKAPQRGDIVMMRYPLNPSRMFVKRVIAQPGDHLHIRAGHVFLNGQPYDDSYVSREFRSRDDWGPEVVPAGHYFVMGDRRNNSSDSRHWGFVPARYVVGRVIFRWWPTGDARRF